MILMVRGQEDSDKLRGVELVWGRKGEQGLRGARGQARPFRFQLGGHAFALNYVRTFIS